MKIDFLFKNIKTLPEEIENSDIFLVGGASRNLLQNAKLPRDLDFTGNFDVERFSFLELENKTYIKNLFSLRFETHAHDFDVTAFRREQYKKGYFPSNVERVETAFEDSFRRDFSINSIYIAKSGEVLDFFDGISHLQQRKIVANTENTLRDDGMRIYRMVRFALTLGFEIEKSTLDCAMQNKDNICVLQKGRCKKEYDKFAHLISRDNIGMISDLGIFSHQEISLSQIKGR